MTSRANRLRGLLVGGVLLVAAGAVAGCGAANAVDPVAKAATVSSTEPGYQMTFLMQLSSPALPTPVTGTGLGSFLLGRREGSFAMTLHLPSTLQSAGVPGGTLQLNERLVGNLLYLRLPAALRGRLPSGRPWLKIDTAKAAAQSLTGLSGLNSPVSSDPSQYLQYLHAVSGKVTKVGTGQVAGFQTTHYRAQVDLSKVAASMPSRNRAAAQRAVALLESEGHVRYLPTDVWVDGDNLVRRIQLALNLSLAQGVPLAMSVQLTIPRYGPQAPPQLPPANQVTDLNALLRSAPGRGG